MKLLLAVLAVWVATLAVLYAGLTIDNPVVEHIDPQPNLSESP